MSLVLYSSQKQGFNRLNFSNKSSLCLKITIFRLVPHSKYSIKPDNQLFTSCPITIDLKFLFIYSCPEIRPAPLSVPIG